MRPYNILKELYHFIVPQKLRLYIKLTGYGLKGKISDKQRVVSAWMPDSARTAKQNQEMFSLWDPWTQDNGYNNCGDFFRFYSMILNIKQVMEKGVRGDFAELGVYKGNSAAILNYYAKQNGRKLYLFDTFEGFDGRDIKGVDQKKDRNLFSNTSLEAVKNLVGSEEHIKYFKGYFPDTITDECRKAQYAFVNLDCDLYQPILEGLKFFWPRLIGGGYIFCHDYSSGEWMGCKKAVDEFAGEHHIPLVLLPDKSGTVVLTKV